MCEKITKWIEENPIKFLSLVALFVIVICVSLLLTHGTDVFFVFPKKITRGNELDSANSDEVNAILFFLTGMATVALVLVAYIQLQGLNKNSKADMLLRINTDLRSNKALKAKQFITQKRLESELELRKEKEIKDIHLLRKNFKDDIVKIASEKIKAFLINGLSEDESKINSPKIPEIAEIYPVILDFLNTIEAVCYLCNRKYVSAEDIAGFFEYELVNLYDIFSSYIEYLEKFTEKDVYNEFKNFKKKIDEKNQKIP